MSLDRAMYECPLCRQEVAAFPRESGRFLEMDCASCGLLQLPATLHRELIKEDPLAGKQLEALKASIKAGRSYWGKVALDREGGRLRVAYWRPGLR